MPTHARLLESLIEDYLAAGFGDPAADRFTSASASGEIHVLAIVLEVVQAGVIIFLRALQADPTSLLSGAADHARDTVRLVTKDPPLLFGPLVGLFTRRAEDRAGQLRDLFTSRKEVAELCDRRVVMRHVVMLGANLAGNVGHDSPIRGDTGSRAEAFTQLISGRGLSQVRGQPAGDFRQGRRHAIGKQSQANIQGREARRLGLHVLIEPAFDRDDAKPGVDLLLGAAVASIGLACELEGRRHCGRVARFDSAERPLHDSSGDLAEYPFQTQLQISGGRGCDLLAGKTSVPPRRLARSVGATPRATWDRAGRGVVSATS